MLIKNTYGGVFKYGRNLRNPNVMGRIPDKVCGWYRWYVRDSLLGKILNSDYLNDDYYTNYFKYNKKSFGYIDKSVCRLIKSSARYYCIYVGITEKSFERRFKEHLNNPDGLGAHISVLLTGKLDGGVEVEWFIDGLIVEYHVYKEHVATGDDEDVLRSKEYELINAQITPLNLENNDMMLKEFIDDVEVAMKNARS